MTGDDEEQPADERKADDSRGPSLSRRSLIGLGLLGLGAGAAATQFGPRSGTEKPAPATGSEPPREGTSTMTDQHHTPRPQGIDGQLSDLPFRYASPGDVQGIIDRASQEPQSRVLLYPETVYETSSTWNVREGVTLDYNGAAVEHQQDVDVHEIHPGGCVERPMVDLRTVDGGFSSSVFTFDSRRHGFYGDHPNWYVRGGMTRGQLGDGTLYEFIQGNGKPIYFVHADHAVRNIGTVVDMHRGDAFGINGNRIYGLWYGFEVGIRMRNRSRPDRSVDNISGNHFDVIAQPQESRILWDLEAGHYNVLRGRLWDFSNYSDVLWRIHGDGAESRGGNILQWFPVGGDREQLVEEVGPRVFDDQLGDPRNRVVIPWLQGLPVGDLSG